MTNTMVQMSEVAHTSVLGRGTPVDVRSRFVGAWTRGFVIEDVVAGGYTIRRVSDDSVLPDVFSVEEIRPERRKQSMWWY